MKKNIIIIVVVVLIIGLISYGYKVNVLDKLKNKKEVKENVLELKKFEGEVSRFFEGDNVIKYSFDIPKSSSATTSMEGALIKVIDNNNQIETVYISYEGGRGFTPLDYINEIIAPHVSVITPTSTLKIGNIEWQEAESGASKWFIGNVLNGQWLVVVEGKKSNEDKMLTTLKSFEVK